MKLVFHPLIKRLICVLKTLLHSTLECIHVMQVSKFSVSQTDLKEILNKQLSVVRTMVEIDGNMEMQQ